MRKAFESLLFSCKNQGLYPADQDIFDCDGNVLVGPGQIAVWDPRSKKSLGPGITVADYDKIVVSVGIDQYNLRSNFAEELYGCNIKAASAEGSKCGVPQIVDLFYGCVHCDDEFAVAVHVDNNKTKNQFPYNKKAIYTATAKLDCCSCDSCENGVDCHKLSCLLKDQFEGERRAPLLKRSTMLPAKTNKYPKGFTTHILYGGDDVTKLTTKVFCVNPVKDTCTGDCIHADTAITEVTFNGTTVPLKFTVDSADPTKTLLYQLDSVVKQINKALDGNGSAAVTKGFGKCCPYRLEVNTCFTDFAITGLTACEEYNPFAKGVPQASTCKNCELPPADKTFTCGLRFIADPIEFECGCNPNLNPIYDKGNSISVFPVKGFTCDSWAVVERQKAELPENLGYDWLLREYKSDVNGRGRNHDNYEWPGYGYNGLPLDRGRTSGISPCVNCAGQYCSYVLEHNTPRHDFSVHGQYSEYRGRTIVLIPTEDSITRTEFEAIINPYLTSQGCPIKKEITCAIDQDQVQNPEYPDYNGDLRV
jgi:hypothetical protein